MSYLDGKYLLLRQTIHIYLELQKAIHLTDFTVKYACRGKYEHHLFLDVLTNVRNNKTIKVNMTVPRCKR